ncbi:MAG: helix-turn-helix domain-containing protein, partial [Pseudomonadota bacterium]
MNKTGSLCPTIKAAEVLGDKWTILILRELYSGATRYSDFQRAIPRISPTILSARLKKMEQDGLIIRKTRSAQKGGEYRFTKSAKELAPIVDSLARWGLRWARDQLRDVDLDAGTFLWDFHRTLNTEIVADGRHTFC